MWSLLTIISWFIVPIAAPAWLLEGVYRRLSKRFWEFNVWSGTFYILFLVGLATVLSFAASLALRVVALYIFTTLEVLGIFLCATVPFGNIGGYVVVIRHLARRKPKPETTVVRLSRSAIWTALTSYFYTAFYFGILNYFLYSINSSLYTGVQGETPVEILFDFIYFSYISMTTFGFTALSPAAIPSKIIYMVEVAIGLFFMLFIFSLLTDRLISRRNEGR